MSAPLCACGCGASLVGKRRGTKYATKGCVLRANRPDADAIAKRAQRRTARMQADPALRLAWLQKLRQAHARRRMQHWWQDAHLARVWRLLERRIALDLLTHDEQQTLRVVLARLMRVQYQRGYRVGWQTATRRAPMDSSDPMQAVV